MTYSILRMYIAFLLKLLIKDLKVNGKENIPSDRAILFAAFHSNSFLDGMVLGVILNRPVWSLARGDAFKNPLVRKFLNSICLMPIYRMSEGKEYLGRNDETFERCSHVFKEKGQVEIFSEGLCKYQTELLPLKKGTARIVLQSWEAGIDVSVIPTAVNYSQFTSIGKKVLVNFGTPIEKEHFEDIELNGANALLFNEKLSAGIEKGVSRDFNFKSLNRIFYYIMYAINFPLYYVLTQTIRAKTKGTVFFDSIFLASLLVAIPLYWIFLASLTCYFLS